MNVAPFGPDYRSSGILLHLTSLPSSYGIGDAGVNARRWVDLLRQAGQGWWQFLPLGPPGYCNCPYQLASTFARNPLLINPEQLIADGLLKSHECRHPIFSSERADFDAVSAFKQSLIERIAAEFQIRASSELKAEFQVFCGQQSEWLDDYALYECLKQKYQTGEFQKWPRALVERDRAALAQARDAAGTYFEVIRLGQFLAFRQLSQLKAYAAAQGLRLLGDLPFFVAPDSCDAWAHPEFFQFDEQHLPVFVSGVPPDYFTADGQLWGHPVFDWDALRQSGYRWWLERIRNLLEHVDVIRLDHFRAFQAAWHIPRDAQTARAGEWQPGPGADLLQAMRTEFDGLPFLAEDLGLITPDVIELRDQFELPGMDVLQFAFDGDANNPFLPSNVKHNSVAYTGTHDNDTSRGWYQSSTPATKRLVSKLLKESQLGTKEIAFAMMQLIWSSGAAVAIAPLQDLLGLKSEDRMNVPGRSENNWEWRCTDAVFSDPRFEELFNLTSRTKRLS